MGEEREEEESQSDPMEGNFLSAREMVERRMRSARGVRRVECMSVMP